MSQNNLSAFFHLLHAQQVESSCAVALQLQEYAMHSLARDFQVPLPEYISLQVQEVDAMPDPCPLPSMVKKRGLNEKERLLYAPMSDVGGLLYDKDAVYIDVPDWKVFPFLPKNQVSGDLKEDPLLR